MYYNDSMVGVIDPPDDAWKPVWWTPMKSERTLGDKISDFTDKYIVPPRLKPGLDGSLLPPQRWLLRHVFELKEDGKFRYKEVYIFFARKNGKSLLASDCSSYFLAKGKDGDQIYCAARARDQAKIVYKETLRQIRRSRALSQVIKTADYMAVNRDPKKNITMKPLSADSKNASGFAPYFSIGDELWAWDTARGTSTRGREMLDLLLSGSGDRDESMFFGISTAGDTVNGLAHEKYEKGKAIARGEIEDDSFGFFCWEVEEFDDYDDPKVWPKANPLMPFGVIDVNKFAEEWESAKLSPSTAGFRRFRFNQWVKNTDGEQFILPLRWKEIEDNSLGSLYDKTKDGSKRKITVGFDGSLTEDSTGIVGIDLETGLMQVLYGWEKDQNNPDWFVDVYEVKASMDRVFENFDVVKLYADPSRHQDVVAEWKLKYGSRIVRDIPPHPSRMVPMSETFRTNLYNRELHWNNCEKNDGRRSHFISSSRFTEHVMNAFLSEKGLPRKEQRNSSRKIDFLVCAILANGARSEILDKDARINKMRKTYRLDN